MSKDGYQLIILRGLPGSGKTSFAEMLKFWVGGKDSSIHAADDFFIDESGAYNFDMTKLGAAHLQCQRRVQEDMENCVKVIVVHNTSTTEKELKPYLDLAAEFEYQVVSLIVENRHGSTNVHNVPEEALQRMNDRFSVKLI